LPELAFPDGGVSIQFKLNRNEVCTSNAIYKSAANNTTKDVRRTIDHMEVCAANAPIKLAEGDTISLTAFYDLGLYPAREQHGGAMAEGMAMFVGPFAMANDGV